MGTEAVGLGDRAVRAPARVGLARACPGVGGRPSRPLPPLPGFMAPAGSREDRQRSSNGRRPGTREPPTDHLQQQILRDRPYATFLSVSQGAPFVFSLFYGRYSSQIHTIRLLYLDVFGRMEYLDVQGELSCPCRHSLPRWPGYANCRGSLQVAQ